MSIHKSVGIDMSPVLPPEPGSWRFSWPNTADFNFNYHDLLAAAESTALARNTCAQVRIAIIGAGLAGLVAARELFRCGYTNIDIYEASDRIGGRTHSIPAPLQLTCFEMGAMRIPFFARPGSRNSVLDHYRQLFGIRTCDFPSPGSQVADTGIYLNDGLGPDPAPGTTPSLLHWRAGEAEPPDPTLRRIHAKWRDFATRVTRAAKRVYATPRWQAFWHSMVQRYWDLTFRELVLLPPLEPGPDAPGDFGGPGMDAAEAELFRVIGAGDGGWGAFYDVSCLFCIRTLLSGFGANHQLIVGRFDPANTFLGGLQYRQPARDSLGHMLAPPQYLGVQTFAECLLYEPVASSIVDQISLYEAVHSPRYDLHLYTSTPVRVIRRMGNGLRVGSSVGGRNYHAVVLTPPTGAVELGIEMEGFDQDQVPLASVEAIEGSRWISCCKVFYPLAERYWHPGSRIPQVMATDTFLQGVYGYAVDDDPGVLLASYTWEDDAAKLFADTSDAALARKCLGKLDEILERCDNVGVPISPCVDTSLPVVVHWSRVPSTRGCARLYRARSWRHDQALLAYNQSCSAASGLYFAGEAFSLEGGWTEPAVRLALDAVLHIIKNNRGQFLNGFSFERDYPRHTAWSPGQGA